ncbi:MAG: MerR family DNA-binding transcriptional regulator [Bacteroidetes bacterium]|nr:MerR family DNA-binding transcriptional regulator [Bacteroidota bacterium]
MDVNSLHLSTHEVAKLAGIHRDTLLRWLREKRIPEPQRNRNGWRVFTDLEAEAIIEFSQRTEMLPSTDYNNITPKTSDRIQKLYEIDWDFSEAKTGYLTHSVHPYPAKFIPQIPRTLIRELASTGDTVLDPFCGSGTTLVEAVRMECNAVGIDANPLACMISRAKTTKLDENGVIHLQALYDEIMQTAQNTFADDAPLFKDTLISVNIDPDSIFPGVADWFEQDVINELAFIRSKCRQLISAELRDIALSAFSSIIVTVSKQDSDTRYVRREKKIKRGDCLRLFCKSLKDFIRRSMELSEEVTEKNTVIVYEASILHPPLLSNIDLVVCSPPYPNAYSYHLYHRTRMLWLEMDQPKFKQEEIGSHRKYSNKGKNKATVETFKAEFSRIFGWLHHAIKPNGYACFVIGDSTLEGKIIQNDLLIIGEAEKCGFQLEANINRNLLGTKKSFNPKIGKIRDEHIVILSNQR